MFKRQKNKNLAGHIEYYTYKRDKSVKIMPEADKTAIAEFYKLHKINYDALTNYQQIIVFKRTVNFIFIIAHFFDKKSNAKYVNPMDGPDQGTGVVRSQGYIFYKDGSLLYEIDNDRQSYADNQIEEKKINKRNYELHQELNNEYLDAIGNSNKIERFDRASHELIKQDDSPKSVDFIITA